MSEIRTASFKIDDFLFLKTFETPIEIQGMPRRVSREGAEESVFFSVGVVELNLSKTAFAISIFLSPSPECSIINLLYLLIQTLLVRTALTLLHPFDKN